jgi:hypothetical protein
MMTDLRACDRAGLEAAMRAAEDAGDLDAWVLAVRHLSHRWGEDDKPAAFAVAAAFHEKLLVATRAETYPPYPCAGEVDGRLIIRTVPITIRES